MLERRVTVQHAEGLHARPAAMFVKLAGAQPVPVTVRTVDGRSAPSNSILAVMTLGVACGEDVVLETADDGAEGQASLDTLAEYLTSG